MTVSELPQQEYEVVVFAHDLLPMKGIRIRLLSLSLFGYDVPLVIDQAVCLCRCPVERETRTHYFPSPGAESVEIRVDQNVSYGGECIGV
jgi:hypothetical protein